MGTVSMELKPCPFCGGKVRDLFCTANGAYTSVYYNQKIRGLNANHSLIACEKCGCRTKVYLHMKNAIKAWNRRAEKSPCDCCRYYPPSSMDGKPCTMCVAEGRVEDATD